MLNNKSSIQYILSSGFDYVDVKNSLGRLYKSRTTTVIPYEELISEGGRKVSESYKRSQRLRNAAIEHFSRNGIIVCDCCGFEFKSFYGEKFGKSCIEIHHLKPIFQYASMSVV